MASYDYSLVYKHFKVDSENFAFHSLKCQNCFAFAMAQELIPLMIFYSSSNHPLSRFEVSLN